MADLKAIGSEKLKGDEKLKRILELTYYKDSNKIVESSKSELVSESKIGGVYGIVREKDGYHVKRGLNESSLDYIGGMFMKNKNRFSSYAEALKRLELIKGQEELQEATKYVLKQNKPKMEEPIPQPSVDSVPPVSDLPSDETPMDSTNDVPQDGEMAPDQMSSEPTDTQGKRSDYMAEIQKYAGKIGQELRDQQEKMQSDDIKYVLNMIISAVDLDKLDLEDLEDIGKKFDRDEEDVNDLSSDEEIPAEEPSGEEEMSEDDAMSALESFINTPIETGEEIDLSKYADLGEDDTTEIDLEEIKHNISKAVGETLSKYFK
jgi:hypothetical protein